jgi:hypothetical protein
MDPLTIAATCISLATLIGKVGVQLNKFVKEVRDARYDLDSVKRELSSLQTVLEVIAEDASNSDITFPPLLTKQLPGIVDNCVIVVDQIEKLLKKYNGGGLRKGAKWAISGRDDVDKLRVSLEAHKSALDMALEMVAMYVYNRKIQPTMNVDTFRSIARETNAHAVQLRNDTSVIINGNDAIKEDTAHIRATIQRWQEILPRTAEFPTEQYSVLNRYFDSLTAYTARSEDAFSDEDSDSDSEFQECLVNKDCKIEFSLAPQANDSERAAFCSGDSDKRSSTAAGKDGAKYSALEYEHNRIECTNRIIQLNSINKKLKEEIRSLGSVHKTNMQSMANALNDNSKADILKLEAQILRLAEEKQNMEKSHSDKLKSIITKLENQQQIQLSRLDAYHEWRSNILCDMMSLLHCEKKDMQSSYDKHLQKLKQMFEEEVDLGKRRAGDIVFSVKQEGSIQDQRWKEQVRVDNIFSDCMGRIHEFRMEQGMGQPSRLPNNKSYRGSASQSAGTSLALNSL